MPNNDNNNNILGDNLLRRHRINNRIARHIDNPTNYADREPIMQINDNFNNKFMEPPIEPINNNPSNIIIDSINNFFGFFKNIFKKILNFFKGSKKVEPKEKINRDFSLEDFLNHAEPAEEVLPNDFINNAPNNHRNPFTKKRFREDLGNFPENLEEGQRTLLKVKQRSFLEIQEEKEAKVEEQKRNYRK